MMHLSQPATLMHWQQYQPDYLSFLFCRGHGHGYGHGHGKSCSLASPVPSVPLYPVPNVCLRVSKHACLLACCDGYFSLALLRCGLLHWTAVILTCCAGHGHGHHGYGRRLNEGVDAGAAAGGQAAKV